MDANTGTTRGSGLFLEGFLLAITNPKPILFFTALFPQFAVLTGIFMTMSFIALLAYAAIGSKSRRMPMTKSVGR